MKVAVTGASGFLGNEVIRLLLQDEDCTIVAFTSQKVRLESTHHSCRLIVYDRNDFKDKQFQDVDVLLNCAFPRNTDGVQMAKGLKYIKEVLEEAVKCKVREVINISSQSVYSQNKDYPASEDSELSLDSAYAVGKYASELLTNSICGDIKHTNIRLASLIGPEFDQRVVNKMIDAALKNRQIVFLGGVQKFGFMDIIDAAKAIVAVIKNYDLEIADVYNIGIVGGYSLEKLAECIKERLISKGIEISTKKSLKESYHNSEIDNAKYCQKFGSINITPIDCTIDRIIDNKLIG